MSARGIRRGHGTNLSSAVSPVAWLFVGLTLAGVAHPAVAAKKPAAKAADNTMAEHLLEQSAKTRVEGDVTRSLALLREAVNAAPNCQPARWMLGQLRVGDEWLSVEEAQRRAAADPHQANYFELREQYGETPEGQLALARWCRKNGLTDEARFHWASVLAVAPSHVEALKALNLRWFAGTLMTPTQINEFKEHQRIEKKARERWEPQIKKWQRAIASKDVSQHDAALDEIRAVTDTSAIPSLETITLDGDISDRDEVDQRHDISLAWLAALKKMSDQAATESLVRHAVLSSLPDISAQASEELRYRTLHDFVPQLLNWLVPPIESSFEVVTNSDGSVYYSHALLLKGTEKIVSLNSERTARQFDANGHTYRRARDGSITDTGTHRQSPAEVAASMARVASSRTQEFSSEAARVEQQVAIQNQLTAIQNQRIVAVLTSTTNQSLGNDPKAWANWWQDYNEYYREGEPPVYQQNYVDNQNYYYRMPEILQNMSCFAAGTPIWTKTGQRPIETLQLGDLVLSQNVDTGELMYKPVIGRTVRPPSQILKLSFGKVKLLTTKGHPLWVEGVGWRMAKELADGAIVHAVTGALRVSAVESAGEDKAYNLVVADSSTYFVGESGILVHDNTPRKPTRAIVPGLVVANK